MKTLIVYYSKSGINEKLALEAARELKAIVEKLVDKDKRRGFFGLLRYGFDAAGKNLAELEPLKNDPAEYDLVVLATPVWAGHLTPAARTFLTRQREKLKKFVFISISGFGARNKQIMADVEATLGKKPSATLLLTRNEYHDNSYQAKLKTFLSSLPS